MFYYSDAAGARYSDCVVYMSHVSVWYIDAQQHHWRIIANARALRLSQRDWLQTLTFPCRRRRACARLAHVSTETRSSATAEKQRDSCAYVPQLANWPPDDHAWRFSAQNTAESQRQYYFFTFQRSDSKSSGRKRILTWNIHSRSFKVIHFCLLYTSPSPRD